MQFSANKYHWMWGHLTSEATYPIWKNANFTNTRVLVLRAFVRNCIKAAGARWAVQRPERLRRLRVVQVGSRWWRFVVPCCAHLIQREVPNQFIGILRHSDRHWLLLRTCGNQRQRLGHGDIHSRLIHMCGCAPCRCNRRCGRVSVDARCTRSARLSGYRQQWNLIQ